MFYVDTYKDICKQLEIHSETISSLETEKYALEKLLFSNAPGMIKGMDYSGQPHGSKDFTSYDRTLIRLNKVKAKLEIEKELLMELNESKERIKTQVNGLEGIYHRVAFLRDIEGKKLEDIANILHRGKSYIENISSNLNKPM